MDPIYFVQVRDYQGRQVQTTGTIRAIGLWLAELLPYITEPGSYQSGTYIERFELSGLSKVSHS